MIWYPRKWKFDGKELPYYGKSMGIDITGFLCRMGLDRFPYPMAKPMFFIYDTLSHRIGI